LELGSKLDKSFFEDHDLEVIGMLARLAASSTRGLDDLVLDLDDFIYSTHVPCGLDQSNGNQGKA